MDERLVPVPQEAYEEKSIEFLRGKLTWLNLAMFALKDEDPHPEYERTKGFYQEEQRKCNKALVTKIKAKRREDGEPDPPDIVIGMKAVNLQGQVLPKE